MNLLQKAIVQFKRASDPEFRKADDEAHAAAMARSNLPNGSYDLGSLFSEDGSVPAIPLGTARWMSPEVAVQRFVYSGESQFTFGASLAPPKIINQTLGYQALGYQDDRHICLVSGTRGGKGVGVLVPNLCKWGGSCIVVDPKGENATVTAQRRGQGSIYSRGMGQKVCILDPFEAVQFPGIVRAHYNPLDTIDPSSDLAVDEAGMIAGALVVPKSESDPYWEEAARNLVKGLILHVISAPYLAKYRNLVAVRRLLTQGDWLTVEQLRQDGSENIPSSFEMLWVRLKRNPAFNGVVAGLGEQMASMAEKTRSGVLEAARTNTDFLDSVPMQKLLEKSDFSLSELKTNPQGLTIYLSLPQRFMVTHYRWLRLMISLSIGEMERLKGRPATGHPTLFFLDEFAGLKRMDVIETAAAQAAGFGVKFCFVVQNLAQLKEVYKESWETFLGNSGLKLFFQIDDEFTRNYISHQLGEMETTRQTQSGSQSSSASSSDTGGKSSSKNYGKGTTRRPLLGFRTSKSESRGTSTSSSSSTSHGYSTSTTDGWGEAVHKRPLLNPDEVGRMLARIDDRSRPGYPGLVLALIPGEQPLLARRVNYFASPRLRGTFDPHPDHPPPPTLAQLALPAPSPKVTKPASKSSHNLKKVWKTTLSIFIWAVMAVGIIGPTSALIRYFVFGPSDTFFGPSGTEQTNSAGVRYATVSSVDLYLREGPGPTYNIVGTMPQGLRVKIIKDADGGWEELEAPGENGTTLQGYANGHHLTPSQ